MFVLEINDKEIQITEMWSSKLIRCLFLDATKLSHYKDSLLTIIC